MRVLWTSLLALALTTTAVAADVSFTWQSRLLSATGASIHGQHSVTLTLYDATDAVLWSKPYAGVSFADGYAAITVSGTDPSNRSLDAVPFDEPVFLGVTLDTAPELQPRQRLGGIPTGAVSSGIEPLPYAATVPFDGAASRAFSLHLTGDATMLPPTALAEGATYTLFVEQDTTGGHSVEFSAGYAFTGGQSPQVTTSPNGKTVFAFASDGATLFNTGLYSESGCQPGAAVFAYTGTNQTFQVPLGCESISIQAWGAGGGGGAPVTAPPNAEVPNRGGGGGYTSGRLAVSSGELLTVIVGQGGGYQPAAASCTRAAFGGGGPGCVLSHAGAGGGGGGRSAVRRANIEVLTAGGGGGAGGGFTASANGIGGSAPGGAGGGSQGIAGLNTEGGGAGTQSVGGAGGPGNSGGYPGTGGSAYQGGTGGHVAGGGGGGFFGGGGGGHIGGSGRSASGGGGSGYVGFVTQAVTMAGSGATPAGTNELGYQDGMGVGGQLAEGGNGMVIVRW